LKQLQDEKKNRDKRPDLFGGAVRFRDVTKNGLFIVIVTKEKS